MKKKVSKRKTSPAVQEMQPEYDFRGGTRGKHSVEYAEGTNSVLLDPDVFRVFPDSESVNEALRALIKIVDRERARRSRPRKTR